MKVDASLAQAPPARVAAGQGARFFLAVPQEMRGLARAWLMLALAALVGAGIFSVLLVLARTPGLQRIFPVADFFHVALVVHVDLSVLVWFIAMAGVLWTLNSRPRLLWLADSALVLASVGALFIAGSAFLGHGEAVMSNYVPVLDDRLFLYGLGLLGIGFGLLALRSMLAPARINMLLDGTGALSFGLNASVVACAVALFALVWSWTEVPKDLPVQRYYELVFWGGGHVIQFTWTLLMLVAWLWLATLVGAAPPLSPRITLLLFAIALASVFAVPIIYLAWHATSYEHQRLHTWLMRFGGGLAILPVAMGVTIGLARAAPVQASGRPLRAALVSSLLLFSLGGAIGFLIHGSNVRIPAHYHGSIVGITLALMGLTYALLPRLGFATPQGRLASLQPYLYGGGQLLHIIGLAWSGGYGVQRKVAGAEQVLHSPQEVLAMGLMGLGGLIAVAGGLVFLLVAFRAILHRPRVRQAGEAGAP